jgi:hypothetical protein
MSVEPLLFVIFGATGDLSRWLAGLVTFMACHAK